MLFGNQRPFYLQRMKYCSFPLHSNDKHSIDRARDRHVLKFSSQISKSTSKCVLGYKNLVISAHTNLLGPPLGMKVGIAITSCSNKFPLSALDTYPRQGNQQLSSHSALKYIVPLRQIWFQPSPGIT